MYDLDRARRAQPRGDVRVARDDGAEERERARGRVHALAVERRDVVLEQDGDAVQRPARALGLALEVERGRLGERAGVRLDDGAKHWTLEVDLFNASKVSLLRGSVVCTSNQFPFSTD